MLKSFEELKQQGFDYKAFEQKRQEMLSERKKALIIGGGVGGGLFIFGLIAFFINSVLAILLITAGLFFFFLYYFIKASKATREVKQIVLNSMLQKIDPSFQYIVGISRELNGLFRKSGFIKSYSGVHIDDVFKGQTNGLNFTLGEIKVTQQRSSGSSSSTRSVTLYRGPFAVVETGNNYEFTTIIPDKVEKLLGGVGRLLQKADITRFNQKLIKIDEDPDFENKFAVWTRNPDFAQIILTPQFRDYLKGIATMSPTFVGYRDNFIFFGMDNRRDLFNLKLKQPISEGLVRQFYDEFKQYYDVLEEVISFSLTGQGANTGTQDDTTPPPPPDTPQPQQF
jgi:hypothetical protein